MEITKEIVKIDDNTIEERETVTNVHQIKKEIVEQNIAELQELLKKFK